MAVQVARYEISSGPCFFILQNPDASDFYLSGVLDVDAMPVTGGVLTVQGRPFSPSLTVPMGATQIRFDPNGDFFAYVDNVWQLMGSLQVAYFETEAPTVVSPGQGQCGVLQVASLVVSFAYKKMMKKK